MAENVTPETVHQLLLRARAGDPATVPALRTLLANPAVVDHLGGDLARTAQDAMLRAMAGNDLLVREATARKLALLRDELAGPNPSPVERLLVERAVACWLQVQDADVRAVPTGDQTPKLATFHQDRLDRAHRRYLSALKALATVRKLAGPVVQVNIARKQVNVAGPAAGDAP